MSINTDDLIDLAYQDVGDDGLISRAIWHTSEESCITPFSDNALINAILFRGLADQLVDHIDPDVLQSKCKELFYKELLKEEEDEIPF